MTDYIMNVNNVKYSVTRFMHVYILCASEITACCVCFKIEHIICSAGGYIVNMQHQKFLSLVSTVALPNFCLNNTLEFQSILSRFLCCKSCLLLILFSSMGKAY